ncbi:hypothetical protein EON64_04180 [archaeon]|nr:MAG: hypothetical protein EON64_04180 [archaeon]
MTGRDGRVCKLENVFIRGGHIKFIVLPDLLRVSPILKKIQALRANKTDADGGKAKKVGMGPNAKKPRKA